MIDLASVTYSGTYNDRIQGVFTYDTETSNTAVKITVKSQLQAKSYYQAGYKISSSIDGSVVKSATGYVPELYTSWTTFLTAASTSKSIARTHAQQTIQIKSQYQGSAAGGWNAGSASGSYTRNVTIPAKPSYSITYNANNGQGEADPQTKWYNETLTLRYGTSMSRDGYTFLGWSTSPSATSAQYSAGGSYTANSSAVLYAVWKPDTYTVTYNANGGSGAPSKQTKTHGVALKLSASKPTRTGYSFVNWNTLQSGSGTSYSAGANYTANASTTLYAQWTAITYSITYRTNGGTGTVIDQTKTYGDTLTLRTGSSLSREGYTLIGWNTKADGSGSAYSLGGNYTANAAAVLYAQWAPSYENPSISGIGDANLPIVTRCNSSGTDDDQGQFIKVSFSWQTYSAEYPLYELGVAYNDNGTWKYAAALIDRATIISRAQSDPDNYYINSDYSAGWIKNLVVGAGIGSDANPDGVFDPNYSYQVRVVVADGEGTSATGRKSTSYSYTTVSTAYFTLDFRAGGKGIGVGIVAPDPTGHSAGLMQIAMDLMDAAGHRIDMLSTPTTVEDGTDINDLTTPGIYWQNNGNYIGNITNLPEASAFILYVYALDSSSAVQRVSFYNGREYIRWRNLAGTWQSWRCVSGPGYNTLSPSVVSNSYYTLSNMNYYQTKDLLIISGYVNCVSRNTSWVSVVTGLPSVATINIVVASSTASKDGIIVRTNGTALYVARGTTGESNYRFEIIAPLA